MAGKKKPKKKPPTPCSPPPLSPPEEEALTALLDNLKAVDAAQVSRKVTGPEAARVLLERLPLDAPAAADIVLWIRDSFAEKAVQRAAKRAIYRLKQRGLTLPDSKTEERPRPLVEQTRSVDQGEPLAFVGPIDGQGIRTVFVSLPQFPAGVDVGMGLIGDEAGILEFIGGRYSKKRMKEIRGLFLGKVRHVVETSPAHAVFNLEKAYAQSEAALNEAARVYLQLRPSLLSAAACLEGPPVYEVIPQDQIAGETLTGSQIDRLLDHELLALWVLEPEEIQPLFDEIVKAEESPILVSEEQKARRIQEIKAKGIARLYPEARRGRMKCRLEETAYIFLKRAQEDYARLALAAALSLEREDSPFLGNPFLRAMVERSLEYYLEAAGEDGEGSVIEGPSSPSIIIP